MNKMLVVILLVVIFMLLLAGYLVFRCSMNKWDCIDGKCVKNMYGSYNNRQDCENSCQNYDTRKKRNIDNRRKRVYGTGSRGGPPTSRGGPPTSEFPDFVFVS